MDSMGLTVLGVLTRHDLIGVSRAAFPAVAGHGATTTAGRSGFAAALGSDREAAASRSRSPAKAHAPWFRCWRCEHESTASMA